MNLEEVINDPRIADLIDPETIPDKDEDPDGYSFFINTIDFLLEEEEIEEQEGDSRNYSDLIKYEGFGLALTPATFTFHESLHAVAAELVGAHVRGFKIDSWGVYTLVSGTHAQAAFVSLFPHLIFPFAFYYTLSRKKLYLVPFTAPTLAEFLPYELFGKTGDFMITATYLSPDYAVPLKYGLLSLIVGGTYLAYKVLDKFKNRG